LYFFCVSSLLATLYTLGEMKLLQVCARSLITRSRDTRNLLFEEL